MRCGLILENMTTTAQDIMSTELMTIREGTTVEDALKILLNSRITGVPVVDKSNKLVGILSEYDILKQMSVGEENTRHEDFTKPVQFSHSVQSIKANTPLTEVIQLFIKSKYRRLLVLDEQQKPIGIITRRDLMKIFYYRSRLT